MENLCMQYLVASFLRWVVTSCAMWGLPTCLSTPSFVARSHQVVPRGLPVHRDRQGVALRVHRVRAAVQDRSEAVDPQDQALETALDPEEARDNLEKVVVQVPAVRVPAAHLAPVVLLGRAEVDRRVQAAAQAVLDQVVHPAHQVRTDPLELVRLDHRAALVLVKVRRADRAAWAHRAPPARQDPRATRVHKAVLALVAPVAPVDQATPVQMDHRVQSHLGVVAQVVAVHRVDLAADQVRVRNLARNPDHSPDPNLARSQVLNRARSQVLNRAPNLDHKAVANHRAQVPVHRDPAVVAPDQAAPDQAVQAANPLVAATAVVQAPVAHDLARDPEAGPVQVPVASAPAALVARGNRRVQVVPAVPHRAAVVLDRRAVAVVPVSSHGMANLGLLWEFPIPAFHKSDHSVRRALAMAPFQAVPVRSSAKSSTQDVSINNDE